MKIDFKKNYRKAVWLGLIIGVVAFFLFNSAFATIYYMEPDDCITVGSDMYCGKWPVKNVTLDYGKSFNEGSFDITAPKFPLINESINMNIGEQKNYLDYDLSVKCMDVNYSEINVGINSTYKDDSRKVIINCALGKTALQDVKEGEVDLKPGEGKYGIRCLPFRDPIVAELNLNSESDFTKDYNFTDSSGTCEVHVNADNYFVSMLNVSERYSECESRNIECNNLFNESDKSKTLYTIFFVIIAIIILGIGFYQWYMNRGSGHVFNFPIPPKFKMKKEEEKPKVMEIPYNDMSDELDQKKRAENFKKRWVK